MSGATSYKVYGRVDGNFRLLGTTSEEFFMDEGLAPGVKLPTSPTALVNYSYTVPK